MFDLVIRNGKIVDGSGREAFLGDLGIAKDKIVAVGGKLGQGRREINAEGHIVTPGWVDIHTHYDGQVTWDPYLTPSSWHGVTTVVMGNCGVGFAPVRTAERDWLIQLMEGVEDIPGAALSEGIQWGWETFPEYLDALAKTPLALDIGAQVPHGALRAYVMGERGTDNQNATADDIAAMAELVREAIVAGALGFSTSRTMLHRGSDGKLVPGTFAAQDELFGIGRGIQQAGTGVFQMTSNHISMGEEFVWMRELALKLGIPVLFNLLQTDENPTLWRELLTRAESAVAEGANIVPNVAGRPAGLLQGWECTVNPFLSFPSYQALAKLPFAERLVELRKPEVRARIINDKPGPVGVFGDFETFLTRSFQKMFRLGRNPNYEPTAEDSIAAIAARTGKRPEEIAYDIMMEDDGRSLIYFPVFGFSGNSMDALREMLMSPITAISLGDGGAHCGAISDASIPTFMLTHWTRDRTRGERIPLEWAVKKQTADTAAVYGFRDRGRIAEGMRADINIIDYENLKLLAPEMVYDLPANGSRLVQRVEGYKATLLKGTVTFENGVATGELPGGLVRSSDYAKRPVAAR